VYVNLLDLAMIRMCVGFLGRPASSIWVYRSVVWYRWHRTVSCVRRGAVADAHLGLA